MAKVELFRSIIVGLRGINCLIGKEMNRDKNEAPRLSSSPVDLQKFTNFIARYRHYRDIKAIIRDIGKNDLSTWKCRNSYVGNSGAKG